MSSSKESSQPLNLPQLNQAFLAACQTNDLEALAKLNTDLSRVVDQLERTSCSKDSVADDNTLLQLFLFSHNVHITSTAVATAELQIEELSNKFTQQLTLVANTPHSTQAPAASSSRDSTDGDNNSSSMSTLVLKKWSLQHLSYLFPSKLELEALASQTAMSQNQINLWFRNARTRSGWSKVFAHSNINKDRQRLETLLQEYDSIKSHGSTEHFKSCLARDELLQLVDKVFSYFGSTKKSKSSKPDSIRPWVKEVLNNALATLKDKTVAALPSLPSRKRARTKKFIASPSPLSQSSTPIAGPSRIPSPTLESARSSLSLPTTSSFSSPGSISAIPLSPFLGSPSSESLFSDYQSPGPVSTSSSHLLQASPVFSSVPITCTSVPSLSPALETTPPNSEPARNLFIPSHLSFAHPNQSTDPDQFEDAEEP